MTKKTNDSENNAHTIFVGGKPFMNYVTAVVMQFTTQNAEKVVVRSRGKFISRAVDIAEVVKSRFLKDQVAVGDIEIDSEEFTNKEGRLVRVSTLDITLQKTNSGPVKGPELKVESVPHQETSTQKPVETPVEIPAEPEIVEPEVPSEEPVLPVE